MISRVNRSSSSDGGVDGATEANVLSERRDNARCPYLVHVGCQFIVDDLCTSLTIDNIRQSDVGRALDALRDAGFIVEINIAARVSPQTEKGTR